LPAVADALESQRFDRNRRGPTDEGLVVAVEQGAVAVLALLGGVSCEVGLTQRFVVMLAVDTVGVHEPPHRLLLGSDLVDPVRRPTVKAGQRKPLRNVGTVTRGGDAGAVGPHLPPGFRRPPRRECGHTVACAAPGGKLRVDIDVIDERNNAGYVGRVSRWHDGRVWVCGDPRSDRRIQRQSGPALGRAGEVLRYAGVGADFVAVGGGLRGLAEAAQVGLQRGGGRCVPGAGDLQVSEGSAGQGLVHDGIGAGQQRREVRGGGGIVGEAVVGDDVNAVQQAEFGVLGVAGHAASR
jgi:hypothetical protein